MQEYLASGLRLGWLIDLNEGQVELYQPRTKVQVVSMPAILLKSRRQNAPDLTSDRDRIVVLSTT